SKEDIVIHDGTRGASIVAKQPVIATESVQRIAALTTVHTIPARRPLENVVAGTAFDYSDPVIAARDEILDVQRIRACDELDKIISTQGGDAELLHEPMTIGVTPIR